MLLMLAGTVFTGIFIAMAAARLTRAQWVRMQGLRPIQRRGHRAVRLRQHRHRRDRPLLAFDRPLVVIDPSPDAALIERARDRGFDLLTGDASRDDTQDLCNLGEAHSVVALTNVDTLNLKSHSARAPAIRECRSLRIAEAEFAASIARHFDFETTFSVAALAGPVFAGLSRGPGARGRIAFGDRDSRSSKRCFPTGRTPRCRRMPSRSRRPIPKALSIDSRSSRRASARNADSWRWFVTDSRAHRHALQLSPALRSLSVASDLLERRLPADQPCLDRRLGHRLGFLEPPLRQIVTLPTNAGKSYRGRVRDWIAVRCNAGNAAPRAHPFPLGQKSGLRRSRPWCAPQAPSWPRVPPATSSPAAAAICPQSQPPSRSLPDPPLEAGLSQPFLKAMPAFSSCRIAQSSLWQYD